MYIENVDVAMDFPLGFAIDGVFLFGVELSLLYPIFVMCRIYDHLVMLVLFDWLFTVNDKFFHKRFNSRVSFEEVPYFCSRYMSLVKLGSHRGVEIHRPALSPAINLVRTI